MKATEVKAAIQKAREALREYKRGKVMRFDENPIERAVRVLNEMQEGEISKEVKELVKESFEMGQAGDVCPTCGGTGRI